MKDNSNNIRVKYVYDAWGNHKVYNASGVEQTSSTFVGNINPIRYRGYYYDTESDMYYCKSRYYKPQINRWINMDDISYLDKKTINGFNLYAYCNNNPVNMSDPSGNDAIYVATYDDDGLPIVGHSQLYYQDEKGDWWVTEFTGNLPWNAKVYNRYWGKISTTELINYLNNKKCDYHYMSGDFAYIYNFADEHKGGNYGGWTLLSNNCLKYVTDALNSNKNRYYYVVIPSAFNPEKAEKNVSSGIGRFAGGGQIKCHFDKCDPLSSLLSKYKI